MIIEYDKKYSEDVKDLLVELQKYIVKIDKEKYNILTDEYKEKYFKKTMNERKKCNGKMLLFKEADKIVGLVVGIVNNEEIDKYDFKAPKRGMITELIVTKEYRGKSIGNELLQKIEEYLKSIGCEDILIEVFGYNQNAIDFYKNQGYHNRMVVITKKIK